MKLLYFADGPLSERHFEYDPSEQWPPAKKLALALIDPAAGEAFPIGEGEYMQWIVDERSAHYNWASSR